MYCEFKFSNTFKQNLVLYGETFYTCRYAFPIKCTEVILSDDKETILHIRAEYDPSKKTKPKVFLSFISCHAGICCLNVAAGSVLENRVSILHIFGLFNFKIELCCTGSSSLGC